MIPDNIRCPQCGSRDVAKIRDFSGGGSEPAKPPTSQHYHCIICGNHFNQSSQPASFPKK